MIALYALPAGGTTPVPHENGVPAAKEVGYFSNICMHYGLLVNLQMSVQVLDKKYSMLTGFVYAIISLCHSPLLVLHSQARLKTCSMTLAPVSVEACQQRDNGYNDT